MTDAKQPETQSNGSCRDGGQFNHSNQQCFPETSRVVAASVSDQSPLVTDPKSGFGVAALSCENAIDLMGVYLAHEMKFSERDQFVNHIRQCPLCHEKLLALEIYLHVAGR
jgi:hypothetical protein